MQSAALPNELDAFLILIVNAVNNQNKKKLVPRAGIEPARP